MAKRLVGMEPVFQRMMHAQDWFFALCEERGFTRAEAEHILKVYVYLKVAKIDVAQSRYQFSHGVYLEQSCLRNAVSYVLPGKKQPRSVTTK